jgi:hypothetical protein
MVFNLQKMGYLSTLIAARVPRQKIKRVADFLNAFGLVTHNYLRRHYFNLWFILYYKRKKEKERMLQHIKKLGSQEILDLPALKKIKLDTSGLGPLLDYKHNALVCWQTNGINVSKIRQRLARMPTVSHCYLRKPHKHFPYNLYTMIHAKKSSDLEKAIKKCRNIFGTDNFCVLPTLKDLSGEYVREYAE